MPMGSIIKVLIFYKEPFWRKEGLSGQTMSDVEPLMLTYDASPTDLSYGALVGFVAGRHAVELGQKTQAERRARMLKTIERFFGPKALEATDYVDKDWGEEEFSGGCYFNAFLPGHLTEYKGAAALREPTGCLHWASTELAHKWYGYIEGAIESGEAAAYEVLRQSDPEVLSKL